MMSTLVHSVSGFLISAFAFVIILVPLVVFHEFGHFIFARIFGVKAEIFSVGFGPTLWSRPIGETEFRLSAIPLGGYVKLLGEDREAELSPSELKRALHRQAPWKRFFIFLGGPLFNFILAALIFMAILAIGEPQVASVVGRVVTDSPAQKAGFRTGDRIESVDGKPVTKYEEFLQILTENPGHSIDVEVLHRGEAAPTHIHVTPSSESGYTLYGEAAQVGDIDGLFALPRGNQVGVSNPSSEAGKDGIQTGDKVVKFNSTEIANWEELESLYDQLPPQTSFQLTFARQKNEEKVSFSFTKKAGSNGLPVPLSEFGLYSSELFIDKVVPDSPAEHAGVQSGARLIGVGSAKVQSFYGLREAVQKSGEQTGKVNLVWEKEGKVSSVEVVPTSTPSRDPVLNKTTQFTVGVVPLLSFGEPNTVTEQIWNPIKLVSTATSRMITLSWRNLVSFKKMLTGSVSMGTLGGPIMIGKIAGESLSRGLIAVLTNMAIFSVGLGVLNIMPIPVLDGGHILLLAVEIVRRRTLTLRQMEIVQTVGLLFILALMGVAFRNDLARLF